MKYDGTKLQEVLAAHKRWAEESEGWTEEDRADLRRADLRGADLYGANLHGADLRGADLRFANLSGADLRGADLSCADLRGANLYGANLHGADLSCADLRGANLYGADLSGANLSGSNLRGANLRGADLSGANLSGTDLRRADLNYVKLHDTRIDAHIPMACPDTGAFIGWKKSDSKAGKVIVKLLIPEDAQRSSAIGRKCRCSKAVVLEIQDMDGNEIKGMDAFSIYDTTFSYVVGDTVTPREPFDGDRFNECGSGIHFFINRQEAVDYDY